MAVLRVDPPWRGLDVSSGPEDVLPGYSPVMVNFLPGRKGRVPIRGGMGAGSAATAITISSAPGGWTVDDTLFWATGAAGGFALSLYNNPTPASIVAASSVQASLNTVTKLSKSYAIIGGSAYGPALGIAKGLVRFNGSTTAVTEVANSPVQAQAVANHLSRLFVLGGSVPGTATPINPNSLYWTDPNPATGLAGGTLAVWQDDASGLTNQIVLPDGENWLGLLSVQRTLYVLSTNSLYQLTGTTPSTFTLSRIADVGLAGDGHAYCAADTGFYFVANDGLRYWDGAQMDNVSGDTMRSAFDPAYGNSGNILTRLPGGYLSVFLGYSRWLVMHETTRAWADFKLDPTLWLSGVAPIVRRTKTGWGLLGQTPGLKARVGDCTPLTIPEAFIDTNLVDSVMTECYSPVLRLGFPNSRATVKRVWVQTSAHALTADPLAWQIAVRDPSQGTDVALTNVLSTASIEVNDNGVDVYAEVPYVQLRHWIVPPAVSQWTRGSVLASFVEYEVAQQR